MFKSCKNCQQNFEITDEDLKFYEKVSPEFKTTEGLSLQLKIPPPTLCPECREQRRMTFRNERSLYMRACDLCGKKTISMFSPVNQYKVYCHLCWWSDKWDAMIYGLEYDLNESFLKQFSQLIFKIPQIAILNVNCENSDYVNIEYCDKNCYMVYAGGWTQDSYYGYYILRSKNCLDCTNVNYCELCYELVDSVNCYECKFSINLENCLNCQFSCDLISCKNCFACYNLRGKEYCFFNEQLQKDLYKEKIKKFISENSLTLQKQIFFDEVFKKVIKKYAYILNSEHCNGDYIKNSKNCSNCYDINKCEDIKNVSIAENLKDSMDCYISGYPSELCYETMSSCVNTFHNIFSNFCWEGSRDLIYCDHCFSCENCFGCCGLRHKQYCILNKQYTKEEYEKLVPKIIEAMKSPKSPLTRGLGHPLDKGGLGDCEWGEFFPSSISPFGYNETVAQEYFPLTKEEALLKGFKWSDYELEFPHVEKTIPANLLPEIISEIPDDILNWAIQCEVTGKPFKIIKPELDFYRKMNLSIPRRHPDQRHKDRMALRNPRKLWKRNCIKCNAEIQTTYVLEKPEMVYCEDCYLKSVY